MSKPSKNKSGMKFKNDFYKFYEHSPAFLALNNALEQGRLPHAILLHGNDLAILKAICYEISEKLLLSTHNNIEHHPDFFSIRPINKMRQINAESIRDLIQQIQHTPIQADQKVATIYEADRMNPSAANAFLKTLEEPPKNTTIFLLTSRPYALLDTIRSRCLNFRIPTKLSAPPYLSWQSWKNNYIEWINIIEAPSHSKKEIEKRVMGIYKLIVHFEQILEEQSTEQWSHNKKTLSEGLSDEEELALQAGISKAIRQQLFTDIEQTTYTAKMKKLSSSTIRKLIQVIAELERITKLIEVNFNEYTALETFLLSSLRIWAN